MKNILYILGFVACVSWALVSCESEDTRSTAVTVAIPSASVLVPYTGSSVSLRYGIGNAIDGGETIASTEEDWIVDFDFSVTDTVKFYVTEQLANVPRYGEVMLLYMYEADTLASNTIYVSQEYNHNFNVEIPYASGRYYGMSNYYNYNDAGQYSVYFSDTPIDEYGAFVEEATYYYVDFWTNAELEGTDLVLLPVGEYTFGQPGENWTVSSESQFFILNPEEEENEYLYQDYIVGGSLTVERTGDVTTITGVLNDYSEGVHTIYYSDVLYFENEGIISALEGDVEVGDISDMDCEARYYGDYYQTGTSNWLFCIYPEEGTGFVVDICADASYDLDGGVPEGTFTISSNGGVAGTFIKGVVFNGYLNGTWLVSFDEEGALTAPYAPICSGTVEISVSGDECTVTVDGYDDLLYHITGSWTGTPIVSDYRTVTLSASGKRVFLKF